MQQRRGRGKLVVLVEQGEAFFERLTLDVLLGESRHIVVEDEGHARVDDLEEAAIGAVVRAVDAAEAGATILLAASVFHFHTIDIPDLKNYLRGRGLKVK